MSEWRAKALELFPNLTSEIQSSTNPASLWIELVCRFQRLYEPEINSAARTSRDFIRAICLYAVWCARSTSPEAQQAAWISFYEDVPYLAMRRKSLTYNRIVKDLVENMGIEEIERSASAIGGRLSPSQLRKFLADARQTEFERSKRSQKQRRPK